jgi:hypothetical protein
MAIIKTKFDRGVEGATNIVDSGTEGTRVATGTTAQRGSTQGQLRFNTTTGLAEYYTGTAFKSIDAPPTVSSISPTTSFTANEDITITGTGFASGATVKFIGNDGTEYTSPSVTVNSSTSITAQTPNTALTASNEPYDIKVTNPSNLTGLGIDLLDAGSSPTFSTASGSLGTVTEGASASFSVSATDPDSGQTVSYSVQSGSLPSGLSLNSSSGAITGTAPTVSADTTSSFTIRASAGGDTTDRAFSIVVENIPTMYDILNTNSLTGTGRNLAILVDPYDTNSYSGSGTSVTNLRGNTLATATTTLNNLSFGGSGAGAYWEATSGSGGRYMSFGNGMSGLTDNTSDAWAYCGWWRFPWEVDDTSNSNIGWIINDGDWSPYNQIGIRYGQGNGYRINSGNTPDFLNVGIPSATYTDKWIFLCAWARSSGGRYAGQGFATATNLTDHATDTTSFGTRTQNNTINMVIGSRPDSLSETIPQGTRLGPQVFFGGGGDSFVTTSESWSEARTLFETIFDATKGRYV